MPTARGGIAAVATGGRCTCSGETSRRVFPEHEVFTPAESRWRAAPPLPTPRHGIAAAVVGGRIFIIGGGPHAGLAQTAVVEVFEPPGFAASPRAPVPVAPVNDGGPPSAP
jgi:hypothetical protein